KSALARAGRLEGRINGADLQNDLQRADDRDAAANEHAMDEYTTEQRRWAAGKLAAKVVLAGGATATTGPVGAALTTGGSSAIDMLGPDEPPEDTHAFRLEAEQQKATLKSDSNTTLRTMVLNAALDSD